MDRTNCLRICALGLLLAAPAAVLALDVQRDPLRAGTNFDIGQMDINGTLKRETQMIQRTSVSVVQEATVEDRLRLSVELDGLFFYPYPTGDLFHLRLRKFVTWVGQAQAVETFGNLSDPWGKLQLGYFPFKYNPDAKNLGEYMFRAGAYPNYIMTGGWSIIDYAMVAMEGVNFEAYTGPLKHNLVLLIEGDVEPLHDLTPAYLLSLNKPNDLFSCGAGVSFGHLISARSAYTTPPGPTVNDPVNVPSNRYKGDSVVFDTSVTGYSNYTFKNIKLMARASFNPQALIKSNLLGPEDLKIYAEAAILGVKDYPFYYDDITRRIPVMVGFNLPTFKWLDMLSVEGEYHKAEFQDDISEAFGNGLPLPALTKGQPYAQAVNTYDKNATKHQYYKWSVYAKKNLMPGLSTVLQVASDHMRGIVFDRTPQYDVITKTPSDWYFLFRVEMGI